MLDAASTRTSSAALRVTETDVRHVAKLSRLRLTEQEVRHFAEQLDEVVDHIARIGELDLEGVEPLAHAIDMTNVLREDVEASGLTMHEALDNAPGKSPPYFEVPKVLGEGGGA